MDFSGFAIGLAVAITILAAYGTRFYIYCAPARSYRAAKIDFIGYLLSFSGMLSLLPEATTLFAPELLSAHAIAGTIWERLDYLSFLLLSVAAGMNIMRRLVTIELTKTLPTVEH